MLKDIILVPNKAEHLTALSKGVHKALFRDQKTSDFYVEHACYSGEKAAKYGFLGDSLLGKPECWVYMPLYMAPFPDLHELSGAIPDCTIYCICGYQIQKHKVTEHKIVEKQIMKAAWENVPVF